MINYQAQFEKLLHITKQGELINLIGEEIKNYSIEFAKNIRIDEFQDFYNDKYGRNLIGKDNSNGWEALVMTWKKGIKTAIHGHPQFAGYTVIAGKIFFEVFEKKENGLGKILEYTAAPFESFYSIGEMGDFENHIHRITCLTDTAHTLHIYSDDALKGKLYNESDIIK